MNLKSIIPYLIILLTIIISVSVVSAANDNITSLSHDFTQNSYEQHASVPEPALQEVGVDDLKIDDSDCNQETHLNQNTNSILNSNDVEFENTEENKNKNSLLSASDDEILDETHYMGDSNTIEDIQNEINSCIYGDVLNLEGKTYYREDYNGSLKAQNITIIGGEGNQMATIDSQNVALQTNFGFVGVTLKNVIFKNFQKTGYGNTFTFINCNLENVIFEDSVSINPYGIGIHVEGTTLNSVLINNFTSGTCVVNSIRSSLENVNFTNSKVTFSNKGKDNGQFTVMVDSSFNNVRFINTSSKQHSGAICMARGENNVTNCEFINCTAWVGGAIYAHGDFAEGNKKYIIENCSFINCSAVEEGGALGLSHNNMDVKNCKFINNSATKGAGIMVGGINHPDGIEGNNTHGHNITIDNCYFKNNIASEEGGAVHISGNNNTLIKSQFYDNEAHEGGAVHLTGVNAKVSDSIFDDNFANHGKGAAVYVKGDYASVDNSNFTNHESKIGTVYIEGDHLTCNKSQFIHNYASHGGAGIYVEGNYSHVYDSYFEDNNASMHGGAIHTIGRHAKIFNSEFRDNHAIPNTTNPEFGLGGAIYIDGRDNEVSYSKFKYNTARNGSAIYNRGQDLILNDDTFDANQAWSYFLFTDAQPKESYWDENLKVYLNVTLVAGDNLINAIYNDRTVNEIYFYNVTYWMNPTPSNPTGKRTTTPEEEHPVNGVENSQGGAVLYQDAREDNQDINLNVTYGGNLLYQYSGKTNMLGNVLIPLQKENLTTRKFATGEYHVTASHPYDDQYTAIENSTLFRVLPHVDVSVTKTSNKDVYVRGENAIFTIKVNNVGTNATNVTLKEILPSSFRYVGSNATNGKYNSTTNEWYIGFMPNGKTETLTLTVLTTELGSYNNVVNVTCNEKDWNLSNNEANKTVHVNLYYTKEANVTKVLADEYLEYYLRVYNVGSEDYTGVIQIRDVLPQGIKYINYTITGGDLVRYINHGSQQRWDVTNIADRDYVEITVKCKALEGGVWNNSMYVFDCPPVNATVNVTGNADLGIVKTVSSSKVKKGDTVTWTITVKNYGPSTAHDVTVTDKLPAGLRFVSSNGNYNKNTGVWIIGDLKKGESKSLVITTVVTTTDAEITNIAVVNSTTPDNNTDNNKDNDTTKVGTEADVKVIKTVSNSKPSKGDTITWTIVVVNLGPDRAEDVVVSEKLPDGLKLISTKLSKGKYQNGVWTIGTLNNGEMVTLTLTTKVTVSGGTIRNVVVVTSSTYDPNNTNNRDVEITKPKSPAAPSADLEVIKVANVEKVKVGDKIIWTITVRNHGPDTAKNVRVTDIVSGDAEYVGSKTSKGSYNPLEGIWTIGQLANGESVKLTLVCKALSEGKVVNTAKVTSDTPDPNNDNNKDYYTVAVVKTAVNNQSDDYPVDNSPDLSYKSNSAPASSTMHATGNPIVIVLLSLLAIVGVSLRRKN